MIKEIYQWKGIAHLFKDNIIIGNGGSIAIAPNQFTYTSLFEFASEKGLISDKVREIFYQVEPRNPDFERVLYQLWLADFINQRLGLDKEQTIKVRKGYTDVRRSLIITVKDIHPLLGDVENKLINVGRFVCKFRTVLYLNYDLLLYWASLDANEKSKSKNRCKDGFNEIITRKQKASARRLKFTSELNFIWEPYRNNRKATAIFYPHGNLMLYQTRVRREERKLGLNGDDILQKATNFWARNDAQPLFVCEGTSEEKLKSISSSHYLTTIYQEVLPKTTGTLVIYGWSIGKQDQHILDQLKHGTITKIAVSIYTFGKDEIILQQEQQKIIRRLDGLVAEENIIFFDASSAGCWCH